MNDNAPVTVIRSGRAFTHIDPAELWHYRDLIRLFVRRGFVVRYKQTVLGPAWLILQPLATSLIHLFLFGTVAGIGTDGVPGILFYLGGNALWSVFSGSFSANATTFTANASLFGKVYFPRLTVPIANMISTFPRFLLEMGFLAVLWVWFALHGQVSGSWLFFPVLPLLLLHLGLLGMGCGILFSSLTTRYRDLTVLVSFGLQLLMYATPVVYPLSTLSDSRLYTLMLLNPVTAPMELFRRLLFGQGSVVWWSLVLSLAVTAIVLFFSIHVFSRVEKTFIDTV